MTRREDQVLDRGGKKFDFDVDAKRGRPQRNEDPYLYDQGWKEPAVCETCHAVYRNKRWYLKEEDFVLIREQDDVSHVTCPSCRKINDKYPEGIVTLRGDYLWRHEEEILNILRSVENTAMAKNPLERIMRITPQGDAMIIETTEEKLAEHIGRALHKAHQGKLDINWTEDHSVCRVSWER
jgi:NMD protein affecting ribosome stability and mRNA decay